MEAMNWNGTLKACTRNFLKETNQLPPSFPISGMGDFTEEITTKTKRNGDSND